MIALDEGSLICDLAETYQIYDYRRVPVRLLATLCSGLRPNSRIMQKATGAKAEIDTLLLASIADAVRDILYGFFAEKGSKRPESYVRTIMEDSPIREKGFKSGDDFEIARKKIIDQIKELENE